MNRFLVLLTICFQLHAFTQTSNKYNGEYGNYYRAEDLFQKEQYAAARIEFRNFLNGFNHPTDPFYIKASYYEAISALELSNNDAVSLLVAFNEKYPENIYKHLIYFRLGNFYYAKKDYKEALNWFDKTSVQQINPENKEEYLFKVGYAHFQFENYAKARAAFHDIKNGKTKFAAPALYYFSHIAYQDKSYQIALDGFLKLQDVSEFAKVVPYYITQIYYLLGQYTEIIAFTPKILDSSQVINQLELNHLVGDAYFRTGNYAASIPYLKLFNEKSSTSRDEDYQLGFAYYKNKEYEKAVRYFDKTGRVKDSLGQISYYHIGECYLKIANTSAARSAFEAAAEITADSVIQEDALYNYAVLSYVLSINPFDEAILAFERFLEKFPKSKRCKEINQYLVLVYTTTNNYAKALASLDKIPNKDAKLKIAYQLVAYNQGVEFFQKAKFDKAEKSFELVQKYPVDLSLCGRAKYWTAESYFYQSKIDQAINEYKQFQAMPATASQMYKIDSYYNLGYAYLKKNDLSQSIDAFRIYCQSEKTNKNKLADANMRIADAYYMNSQNESAVKYYQEVLKLKAGFEDQALFYMAKSYGYSAKEDEKIEQLLQLVKTYPKSKYLQQSIYELAISYKSKTNFNEALTYFNRILNDYPKSELVVRTKIEIADIYYKRWEYANAEKAYKQLLEEYGSDREICATVVRGLVDIYAVLKQPEKASELATSYACANISAEEQEGLYYAPAFEAYNDSAFTSCIPLLEKYINHFPSGKYAAEAQFFLANSYFETGDTVKAIEEYKQSLQDSANTYSEFAASRVAQYYYNGGMYDQALPFYRQLEQKSSDPAVVFNARLGQMRSYFLLEKWDKSAYYASTILNNKDINATIRLEAEYASGMSNYYQSNDSLAKPALEWVFTNTTTVKAAETHYTLASIYYKNHQFENADQQIKALIKMKPTYNYWVAKGLILQSHVFIATGDLFQAEQTLQAVIDHYPTQDDGILTEANELWGELLQLKEKPKEVEPKSEVIIDVNKEEN
jgi:tetratricopeptide (TPR) repeat protein